ncbi:MAG TPA: hypothetical protein VII02_09560 [Gemmatimonadaceae bacterium]
MRISNALGVLLLGAAIALPVRAPAQVSVSVNLGRLLGPEISLFAYSQQDYGDWRTSYRNWTPVTIYDYNGHYYRKSVKGSRAVVVYSRNNEYFLPPQDNAWVGKDKRYNYKRQPTETDRGRAKSKGQNPGRGRGKP